MAWSFCSALKVRKRILRPFRALCSVILSTQGFSLGFLLSAPWGVLLYVNSVPIDGSCCGSDGQVPGATLQQSWGGGRKSFGKAKHPQPLVEGGTQEGEPTRDRFMGFQMMRCARAKRFSMTAREGGWGPPKANTSFQSISRFRESLPNPLIPCKILVHLCVVMKYSRIVGECTWNLLKRR